MINDYASIYPFIFRSPKCFIPLGPQQFAKFFLLNNSTSCIHFYPFIACYTLNVVDRPQWETISNMPQAQIKQIHLTSECVSELLSLCSVCLIPF